MKKKIVFLILGLSILTLSGCTKKEEVSFETKVSESMKYLNAKQNQTQATIEDMTLQIQAIKRELEMSTVASYKDTDINFSSIKILAMQAKTSEDEILLPQNTDFDLSVDVMNSTEDNLSQLTVQAFMTYKLNGEYYDRYLMDSKFDVLPKSVRQDIKLEDFPIGNAKYEHVLTVLIKDLNGNTITSFNKNINVK